MISKCIPRTKVADPYLLHVDNVHDNAPLEHAGEPCLHSEIASIVAASSAIHAVAVDEGSIGGGAVAVTISDGEFGLLRHGSSLLSETVCEMCRQAVGGVRAQI